MQAQQSPAPLPEDERLARYLQQAENAYYGRDIEALRRLVQQMFQDNHSGCMNGPA